MGKQLAESDEGYRKRLGTVKGWVFCGADEHLARTH